MNHAAIQTPPGGADASTTQVMGYVTPGTRRPRLQINVRLMVFLALVATPFAYFLYLFLGPMLSGGIIQHADYAEVDLKALGNFPFDQSAGGLEDVPARWKALDGKRVMLKGFMVPTNEGGAQVHQFQFVYNVQKCCFGGPPLPQERVFGHTRDGVELYDSSTLVRMVGILHVRVYRDKEKHAIQSVFDMDTESCAAVDG